MTYIRIVIMTAICILLFAKTARAEEKQYDEHKPFTKLRLDYRKMDLPLSGFRKLP
ncbi:exported protein of unknown function [Maridesulfovibrio hydrothermalis AM13 = DSM 14728]|uniref:Uncharacterized protein n=1 Tax=Maridesulfovibrio hydrothermalis AM13 = DSM 14728 TaxID=1121451 RepID=L0RF80_9BACT|nr:exported protein of unknown function [Maridesulfovibrio hydrothermalis AM13 = DSM 14728]